MNPFTMGMWAAWMPFLITTSAMRAVVVSSILRTDMVYEKYFAPPLEINPR